MATDTTPPPTRRQWLALLAGGAWLPAFATPSTRPLLACWDNGNQHCAGLLHLDDRSCQVSAQIELPTRGHGVWAKADGTCWVAARRPGDWLLRWHPASGARHWHWVDDDRRLNGHVMPGPDRRLWTTETDQATAEGLIGVRNPETLEKVDEWPSHGMDPHAMLSLPSALGPWPASTLLVANGGIPTQSESGRSRRDLTRIDPSLVALDPRTGQRLGQWRLPDPRLSIRHLTWDPISQRVGVALQAEHDEDVLRRHAPLFAAWDGQALHLGPPTEAGLGYAGDICAHPGGGFWLSATQAHTLLALSPEGHAVAKHPLPTAGALTTHGPHVWAGGDHRLWHDGQAHALPPTWRLDNHWHSLVVGGKGAA